MDKVTHWIANVKKFFTFCIAKIELHNYKVKAVFNISEFDTCDLIAFKAFL